MNRRGTEDFDIKDGISLLSLKNQVLINYVHGLALLSAQRVLGHSLQERTPPTRPFQDSQREVRGSKAGDLVDSLIEGRVILEKEKVLEARMRYQIEKLVRAAAGPTSNQEAEGRPLQVLSFWETQGNNSSPFRSTVISAESRQFCSARRGAWH
jgi:U3 small nucleolar ribonucleoprotein protein LCP5